MTVALVWVLVGRLPFHTSWSPIYLLAFAAPTSQMLLGVPGIGVLPLLALFGLSVRDAVWPNLPVSGPLEAELSTYPTSEIPRIIAP